MVDENIPANLSCDVPLNALILKNRTTSKHWNHSAKTSASLAVVLRTSLMDIVKRSTDKVLFAV